MKISRAYTLRILCRIKFCILCLILTFNVACKKSQQNLFMKNLMGTKNLISNTVYIIIIGTRVYIYRQSYKICAYVLRLQRFISNRSTYDESCRPWIFWTIDSPVDNVRTYTGGQRTYTDGQISKPATLDRLDSV